MWFVFSSLQTNTSEQPQSELSDRGRGHHLIHRYSFVYHSHQKSTSCDCIVQYHSLAYCTGILSLLWHHSCQDGSSVSNLRQTHTSTKDGRITIHTFTFLAFIFVYTVCLQVLKDWKLALGVLTLVLVDLTILLVYTTVEGVHGNLTAIQVPSRENPRVVEGVGWCMWSLIAHLSIT